MTEKKFYDTQPTGENHEVDYRDPTDIPVIADDIKNGVVDSNARNIANWIRTKMYRRHVREALARAVEWMSVLFNRIVAKTDKTEQRQTDVEKQMMDLNDRYDNQISTTSDLNEVIDARTTAKGKTYTTLKRRLDAMDRFIDMYIPDGFTVQIRHSLTYNPRVVVTAYDYAIGTEPEGLATGPAGYFGGVNLRTVPTYVEYEPSLVTLHMPADYKLTGQISKANEKELVLIEGVHALSFELEGGAVGGEILEEEELSTFTPKNLTAQLINDTIVDLKWERGEE